MKNKLFLTCLFLFFILQSGAQDEPEIIPNSFQGTRLVNEQSANLTEKGKLLLFIQHRFGEIDGGLYELFGLDQATMRMGFEYGFGKNLNLGFGRSTFMKTYDAYGKVRLLQQTSAFPVTLVATATGSVPTLKNYFPEAHNGFSEKLSGNIQLHAASALGKIGFQVSPGYHSTGYMVTAGENLQFMTLGLAGSVRLSDNITANLEYLPHFSDKLSTPHPLSLGVDLDTGGHLFQLILSNSQQMFSQGLYSSTTGDWSKGTLFFGFNLIREFRIKYY